jgi:hypothetical protein
LPKVQLTLRTNVIVFKFYGKGKVKVVPVLFTEHHALKAYWGSGDIAPHILDFGTRWR